MTAAREVHITGPETDLRFSIEGIPVVPCAGEMNIPDGEVFTAPVRDSVEGHVRFNTPTIYQGSSFDGVRLEFQEGRIVAADCTGGDVEKLRRIFATDEGAAYIGEWSIGCNPRDPAPDARHPLRREDRRQLPPHPRQRLRRGRQRQPLEDPLGPRPDPAPRLRRRHHRLRRRARSASTAASSPRSCRPSTRSNAASVERCRRKSRRCRHELRSRAGIISYRIRPSTPRGPGVVVRASAGDPPRGRRPRE